MLDWLVNERESEPHLRFKEAHEPSEYLVGRLLVDVMAGRQRFAADVVGSQSPIAERVEEAFADAASGAPQHQDRHVELAAEIGGVELAVDRGPRHDSRRTNRGSSFR